jgi:hypothetical protein
MSEIPSVKKFELDQDRSVSQDLAEYMAGTRPDFCAYYHLEDDDHSDRHNSFKARLQAVGEPVVVQPTSELEPVKSVTVVQAGKDVQLVRTECRRTKSEAPYAVLYQSIEPTATD